MALPASMWVDDGCLGGGERSGRWGLCRRGWPWVTRTDDGLGLAVPTPAEQRVTRARHYCIQPLVVPARYIGHRRVLRRGHGHRRCGIAAPAAALPEMRVQHLGAL